MISSLCERHSTFTLYLYIIFKKSANMAPKINLIKNAIISKKSFPFFPLFIFASCLLSFISSSQNHKNQLNNLNHVLEIHIFLAFALGVVGHIGIIWTPHHIRFADKYFILKLTNLVFLQINKHLYACVYVCFSFVIMF